MRLGMARTAMTLVVVAAACGGVNQSVNADERAIVSYCSFDSGKAFESVITAEMLEHTPAWNDSNPNPPLSVRKAMQLADELRGKLVHDTEEGEWARVAMELRSATDDHWYWLARYEFEMDMTGPPLDLIILVLMDGTVVTPRVYPERRFLTRFGGPLNQEGYFFLQGTKVADGELAHLKGMRCLQSITLNSSELTDVGLRDLQELVQLEALTVSSPKITDAGLEHLQTLNRLEYLTLQSPGITDAGLKYFSRMTGLQQLWLEDCAVAGGGLEHLKGLARLSDLALRGAQIKGPGLEQLKSLSQLKMLDLEDNPLDDAGMAHLSGLVQLQELTLSSTQVTDAGLQHLTELKQLVRLYVRNTHVTDEGAKVLQKALPDCEVIR